MPPKQAPPVPRVILQSTTYNDTLIEVTQGDIITFPITAIVNAADATALFAGNRGGGGLDAQIHAAAGPALAPELIDRYQGNQVVGVGGAYLSPPFNIGTAQYIIHATGPDFNQAASQQEAIRDLREAYRLSLTVAGSALHVKSIALPALSTGRFGFPHDLAARTAMAAVREFLDDEGEKLFDKVVFLIRPNSQENFDAYNNNFAEFWADPENDNAQMQDRDGEESQQNEADSGDEVMSDEQNGNGQEDGAGDQNGNEESDGQAGAGDDPGDDGPKGNGGNDHGYDSQSHSSQNSSRRSAPIDDDEGEWDGEEIGIEDPEDPPPVDITIDSGDDTDGVAYYSHDSNADPDSYDESSDSDTDENPGNSLQAQASRLIPSSSRSSSSSSNSNPRRPSDYSSSNTSDRNGPPAPPAAPAVPAPPVVAPASALPVGARSGTCGANGGRTRANNPCNSRPTRGQNCCRLHHVGTPAPALPGGARPGTCGANGGVTKAGTPCKLPPGRGQSHCRRH